MNQRPPARRSCAPRGFTLLELVVVLFIISVLVLIFMPNSRLARERADKAVDFHKENARMNNDALRGNFDDGRRPSDMQD